MKENYIYGILNVIGALLVAYYNWSSVKRKKNIQGELTSMDRLRIFKKYAIILVLIMLAIHFFSK